MFKIFSNFQNDSPMEYFELTWILSLDCAKMLKIEFYSLFHRRRKESSSLHSFTLSLYLFLSQYFLIIPPLSIKLSRKITLLSNHLFGSWFQLNDIGVRSILLVIKLAPYSLKHIELSGICNMLAIFSSLNVFNN